MHKQQHHPHLLGLALLPWKVVRPPTRRPRHRQHLVVKRVLGSLPKKLVNNLTGARREWLFAKHLPWKGKAEDRMAIPRSELIVIVRRIVPETMVRERNLFWKDRDLVMGPSVDGRHKGE